MKVKSAICLAALLSLLTPAQSNPPNFLGGQTAHDRVTALTSTLHWHNSIGQAETNAREQGKLVFWVHMLGSISGAT
jgi:hypothetical protein